jgi:hypothetical protein
MLTAPIPSFLAQLLEGEPDERQLCAKVLASLQREQASRGKHDRLNTFSIMCKMADQTLFGLVEWARNSALFKELKVIKTHTHTHYPHRKQWDTFNSLPESTALRSELTSILWLLL